MNNVALVGVFAYLQALFGDNEAIANQELEQFLICANLSVS